MLQYAAVGKESWRKLWWDNQQDVTKVAVKPARWKTCLSAVSAPEIQCFRTCLSAVSAPEIQCFRTCLSAVSAPEIQCFRTCLSAVSAPEIQCFKTCLSAVSAPEIQCFRTYITILKCTYTFVGSDLFKVNLSSF